MGLSALEACTEKRDLLGCGNGRTWLARARQRRCWGGSCSSERGAPCLSVVDESKMETPTYTAHTLVHTSTRLTASNNARAAATPSFTPPAPPPATGGGWPNNAAAAAPPSAAPAALAAVAAAAEAQSERSAGKCARRLSSWNWAKRLRSASLWKWRV